LRQRELGFNTALVGWHHPYGRILNRSLTKCYWTAGWVLSGIEEPFHPQSLANSMWFRMKLQIAALPLIGHLPGVFWDSPTSRESARFSYLSDHAREIVADPSIGFALIDLQIPHPPAIYSRFTRSLTTEGPISGIWTTLLWSIAHWADLGRRLGMLASGIAPRFWSVPTTAGERTYGAGLRRTTDEENASHGDTVIPFLLKLPGEISQVAYTKQL
jgi:hypothetical protein